MAKKRADHIDLLILSTFAIVPLLWFREGYDALAGFDFSVYLNPVAALKRSFFLWSDNMAGGYDSSHEVSSMAYYLIFSIPVFLGFSLYTAEKIVFAMIFALQGFSMSYMLGALFGGHAGVRVARLAGAFLYAFSFPVMAHFGRGNLMALLAYALLPLLLGLLKKGFEERGRRWRYILMLALLMFPIASVKGHPADFLVITLVAGFFIILHLAVSNGKSAGEIIKFTSLALLSCSLVSLWWIVPNIIYLADFGLSTGDLVGEGFFNIDVLSYYSNGTSMLKAFRNESLDLWFDMPSGILFNPELYQSIIFIFIGLLIPLMAFVALLRSRIDPNIIFFSILGLGALFMFKGNHPPFGWVFEFFYMYIPGFFLFRAPYRIFSSLVTFSMAPLCALVLAAGFLALKEGRAERPEGNSLVNTHDRWVVGNGASKRLFIRVLSAFFIVTAVLYAWPVFTGAHMRERGTAREPGVFQNIPAPYYAAAQWINGLKGPSKIYFPYEIYDLNTTWGYNGPDPLFELIEAPKMVSRPGGTVYVRYQRPVEAINRLLSHWEYGDLKAVLGLQGASHILLHDDLNRWAMPEYNFNEYVESLFESYGINMKNDFGPVKIYENNSAVERLYTAEKAYLYSGDASGLPDLSVAGYLERPFLVFAGDVNSVVEAEVIISQMSGLIMRSSTLADAVVELLSASHRGEYKDGKLSFKADQSGRYHIYMRDQAGPNSLHIDSGVSDPHAGEESYIWRRLATIDAKEGEQEVDALWYFNSDKTLRSRFAVISETDFNRLSKQLDSRIKTDGFDLVFLLNGAVADKVGRYAISMHSNGKGYEFARYRPERYSRVTKDAFDKALSWEVSPGGAQGSGQQGVSLITSEGTPPVSVKIRMPETDIGQYPRLVFGPDLFEREAGSFSLKVEMDFVDRDGSKESLLITEKTIRDAGGAVNIMEALGKNASRAIVHNLREVRFQLSQNKNSVKGLSISMPRLEGVFGVKKNPCGSSGGPDPSLDGSGSSLLKNMPCGRWVATDDKGFSGTNPDEGFLLMLRKNLSSRIDSPRVQEFIKESPTRYRVKVSGTSKAHLVFSESFDKDWVLRSATDVISPVKVNGYANGFLVDVKGFQEYTIEYAPQRFYGYAGIASAISLLAVALMAVTEGTRARTSSKKEGADGK